MDICDVVSGKLKIERYDNCPPLPGTIVKCLMPGCGKPFLMRKYVGSPDQICPECSVTYADCARIICSKCSKTIARVVPKIMDNGFYIRPRMVLHTDKCGKCTDNLRVSNILEIVQYEKTISPRKIIVANNYRQR